MATHYNTCTDTNTLSHKHTQTHKHAQAAIGSICLLRLDILISIQVGRTLATSHSCYICSPPSSAAILSLVLSLCFFWGGGGGDVFSNVWGCILYIHTYTPPSPSRFSKYLGAWGRETTKTGCLRFEGSIQCPISFRENNLQKESYFGWESSFFEDCFRKSPLFKLLFSEIDLAFVFDRAYQSQPPCPVCMDLKRIIPNPLPCERVKPWSEKVS